MKESIFGKTWYDTTYPLATLGSLSDMAESACATRAGLASFGLLPALPPPLPSLALPPPPSLPLLLL